MKPGSYPPLTAGGLDRDAMTRLSEGALDAAWAEESATRLRLQDGLVAVRTTAGGATRLDLQSVWVPRESDAVYLGRIRGNPVFAVEYPAGEGGPGEESTASEVRWEHPFSFASDLPPEEAEVLAVALALTAWHRHMGFSPEDGSATEMVSGGWGRHDTHGREHFPRMDPVVIVLVEHGDRLLLGSNVLWESGRFSLLAGFVEAGESAEQAVVREIAEESGAVVTNIRYVASQPWPFPRSFMLGFRAQLADGADPEALVPDSTELSELRWFTRDELERPGAGIRLPMPMSIARWMIDGWVAEGKRD